MKFLQAIFQTLLLGSAPLMQSISVEAAISLNRTRIIITENEREATPRIVNEGTRPVLLETWVDTGDSDAAPDSIDAPFIIEPPIFRLDSMRSKRIRVLFTGETSKKPPRDRESVYWINVLEVPPNPDSEAAENQVSLAFRTRLKLFYRPHGLSGDPSRSYEELQFECSPGGPNNMIRVINPTPFHQTLLSVSFGKSKEKSYKIEAFNNMLPPYEKVVIRILAGVKVEGLFLFP